MKENKLEPENFPEIEMGVADILSRVTGGLQYCIERIDTHEAGMVKWVAFENLGTYDQPVRGRELAAVIVTVDGGPYVDEVTRILDRTREITNQRWADMMEGEGE